MPLAISLAGCCETRREGVPAGGPRCPANDFVQLNKRAVFVRASLRLCGGEFCDSEEVVGSDGEEESKAGAFYASVSGFP